MRLAYIQIFPIKALDPMVVASTRIGMHGSLEHDREFAIFDEEGRFINGKRTPKVHGIAASFSGDVSAVTLDSRDGGSGETFFLDGDLEPLSRWLSGFLGQRATVRRNAEGGFPDDTQAHGPTVISTATLNAVAAWFEGVGLDDARLRFRTSLEVEGGEPFWEDALAGRPGAAVRFRIGGVRMEGSNLCQRCVVPSRDPRTAGAIPGFQRRFAEQREASLPPGADRTPFNHYYRLAVNTNVPRSEWGKRIAIGDAVAVE